MERERQQNDSPADGCVLPAGDGLATLADLCPIAFLHRRQVLLQRARLDARGVVLAAARAVLPGRIVFGQWDYRV